jgi:hypothetical protein
MFWLALMSLVLRELFAHIVQLCGLIAALITDVYLSTLAFLNGELPPLCSSLFQDTAPAK